MKYISLIICFFILLSCNSEKATKKVIVDEECDLSSVPYLYTQNIIEDLNIVQLKTPKDVVVGNIDKVFLYDSLLFLVCGQQERLFIFSKNGDYINDLYRHGHSANEYIHLWDAFVDEYNKTLNIYCRESCRLLSFDLYGRKLLQSVVMPKCFTEINCMKDGYVCCIGNYIEDEKKPYNYWFVDRNLNMVNCCGVIDEKLDSHIMPDLHSLSLYKDRCNGTSLFCYDVYSFNSKECELKYQFDFGKYNIPDFSGEDLMDNNKFNELCRDYVGYFRYFQETNNYCYIVTNIKGLALMYVYDKKTGLTSCSCISDYIDDVIINFGQIKGIDERHIYTALDKHSLCFYYSGKDIDAKYQEQVQNLRKKVGMLQPGDNPVVMIWSIKQ